MPSSDLFFIIEWWSIFLLIGLAFLPLTAKIFSGFIDKGYIFSKILGLLITSYIVLILGVAHISKFTQLNIFIIFITLTVIIFFYFRNKKVIGRKDIKIFLLEELIFFITLFLWSYIKGFNPDVHDLEKYMDFGFINSILRSEYFPPKDMWLTPFSINYYYFGHFFTAVMTKISQIPSFITFNLMLASIFAFTFSMSFSIGINLVDKIKKYSFRKKFILGLFFAYIVSFAGNLQTLYAFFTHYNSEYPKPFWELGLALSTFPNSYWYPSATRFIYHTIHEFPLYSFVVADLHGHVLDIPVVLTMLAIFISMILSKKISLKIVILLSFLLSIAYMTNAWDGLIYLGLSGIFFIFIIYQNINKRFKDKIFSTFIQLIKPSLALFITFFIFSFVFNKYFTPFATGIGLNCSPQFLIDIRKVGPFIFEKDFCQITPIWELLVLYGFFIFMFASLIIFLRKRTIITTDYFVMIISFFSFLLILAPEIIYLKDIYTGHFRANTMFKLSYQAFIMLSISSVYSIIRIVSELRGKNKNLPAKIGYTIFVIFGLFLLFLVAIYPYFAIPSGYGNLNTQKGLDGLKYLENIKPGDYKAINFINENISGQPVILEAQGDSYTDFARVSANTGLPTVLGWTVHEWLWRGSYDIPSNRFADISNLYETTDEVTAKKIIDKYDIKYIYVGILENEKYKVSEDKFSKLGKLIYNSDETRIYELN